MYNKILTFCFLIGISTSLKTYDAWWYEADTSFSHKVLVVKPCHSSNNFDNEKFNKFCNNSKKYAKQKKRNNICLRTGLLTKEKCEDIIEQNTAKKRIIRRLIED